MKQRSSGPPESPLRGVAATALGWAQRHVRPAHGAIAVCVAAGLALAGSQLLDYRGVSIGAPAYVEVSTVAPAPEVERQRATAAHGWAIYPIAFAALAVTGIAGRGRWRIARLLAPLGLAAMAISLLVDAPRGLDSDRAALVYEGAEAVLLGGFWAQLFAGAALACCGPLLAAHLRADAGRNTRGHRGARRAPTTGSRRAGSSRRGGSPRRDGGLAMGVEPRDAAPPRGRPPGEGPPAGRPPGEGRSAEGASS